MKSTVKNVLAQLMRLLSLPVYLLYLTESLFTGRRRAFGMASQWAAGGITNYESRITNYES